MEQQKVPNVENCKQEKSKRQPLPKLKAFESIQFHLATVGITPCLANQSYPINGSISYGFLLLGSCIYFSFKFLIYDAETYIEYTQSVFAGSLATLILLALIIIILKVQKLFEFIHSCENSFNTREKETFFKKI